MEKTKRTINIDLCFELFISIVLHSEDIQGRFWSSKRLKPIYIYIYISPKYFTSACLQLTCQHFPYFIYPSSFNFRGWCLPENKYNQPSSTEYLFHTERCAKAQLWRNPSKGTDRATSLVLQQTETSCENWNTPRQRLCTCYSQTPAPKPSTTPVRATVMVYTISSTDIVKCDYFFPQKTLQWKYIKKLPYELIWWQFGFPSTPVFFTFPHYCLLVI